MAETWSRPNLAIAILQNWRLCHCRSSNLVSFSSSTRTYKNQEWHSSEMWSNSKPWCFLNLSGELGKQLHHSFAKKQIPKGAIDGTTPNLQADLKWKASVLFWIQGLSNERKCSECQSKTDSTGSQLCYSSRVVLIDLLTAVNDEAIRLQLLRLQHRDGSRQHCRKRCFAPVCLNTGPQLSPKFEVRWYMNWAKRHQISTSFHDGHELFDHHRLGAIKPLKIVNNDWHPDCPTSLAGSIFNNTPTEECSADSTKTPEIPQVWVQSWTGDLSPPDIVPFWAVLFLELFWSWSSLPVPKLLVILAYMDRAFFSPGRKKTWSEKNVLTSRSKAFFRTALSLKQRTRPTDKFYQMPKTIVTILKWTIYVYIYICI